MEKVCEFCEVSVIDIKDDYCNYCAGVLGSASIIDFREDND